LQVEEAMSTNAAKLTDLAPNEAARELARVADQEWLDALQCSLDRQRARADIDRVLAVWGLSQSDAARLFHVTRQAIAKWRRDGLPHDRVEAVSDLAATTDLLLRYLKRDRIPAVVRRPAARLGNRSMVDLVAAGRTVDVLEACRAMFEFGDAHA
jgi:hypothetical protein